MSFSNITCPTCKKINEIDTTQKGTFCIYCGTEFSQKTPPPTNEDFIKIIKKHANAGDMTAQCQLATLYKTGMGIKQNYTEAMKWYLLAANQGDSNAMYNIGQMYSCGLGVNQNKELAMEWYLKAERARIKEIPLEQQTD